jgi:hypothetical protein
MRAIEICRTAELGGHVDECDHCGALRISYNSCRNRHCPKCQCLDKERWLEARKEDLLPTQYFHVVFTIPEKLNPLALSNQRVFYNLLFRAVSETLKELAGNPKHLEHKSGLLRFCIPGHKPSWIIPTSIVLSQVAGYRGMALVGDPARGSFSSP